MLATASALKGYSIEASDGSIGSVSDFLFEDNTWKIRWLVDNTGSWLIERQVLIPPSAILELDFDNKAVRVNLTKSQVESSPEITKDEPVSRQMEHTLYTYYGWDPYWSSELSGFGGPLMPSPYLAGAAMEPALPTKSGDPHLRSVTELNGYHILATDGEIGHLQDLLIDDSSWEISYLAIAERNWLPGKHLLILPETVREISWSEGQVRVGLTREEVEASPSWKQADFLDPKYLESFHGLGQTQA